MEQAMRLPNGFHSRMVTSVYLLAVTDFVGVMLAVADVIMKGPSMSILVANEFSLMLVSLGATVTRYVLNLNDIRRGVPWENRSAALFYLDFFFGTLGSEIYLLISSYHRLGKAADLYVLLCSNSRLLRPAHPHYKGPLHDVPQLHPPLQRPPPLPPSHRRHGAQVPGCR